MSDDIFLSLPESTRKIKLTNAHMRLATLEEGLSDDAGKIVILEVESCCLYDGSWKEVFRVLRDRALDTSLEFFRDNHEQHDNIGIRRVSFAGISESEEV